MVAARTHLQKPPKREWSTVDNRIKDDVVDGKNGNNDGNGKIAKWFRQISCAELLTGTFCPNQLANSEYQRNRSKQRRYDDCKNAEGNHHDVEEQPQEDLQ